MSDDRGDRTADPSFPTAGTGGTQLRVAKTQVRFTDLATATVAGAGERTSSELMLSPGVRVRQYEIIREIGRGGMGRVMLARDTKLGRRVAMKFMTSKSRELTERFLVEATTTARVSHENIVVIHEVDEHDGTPYMVLEYLEGASLRTLLDGTRMPAIRAIELVVPVVRALARAHDAGIVHRDLKPENVFVTDTGGVKVLDFGIAKLLESDTLPRSPARAPRVTFHTSADALVGTLPYMSPEQLGADTVDHRTDLWAVGIILYELVTGKHPLTLTSATAMIAEVADLDMQMPVVGAAAPDVPERLERAIDRCLLKRKSARYASAHELLDDLEPLLPARYGRQLGEDESPFPGLTAFQETDADRFFGRSHDVASIVTRLRDQPLVGIVGPSGVGKSSLVRAGVVPALKSTGEAWEVYILRPGRQPLASLANLMSPLSTTNPTGAGVEPMHDHSAMAARFAHEPGYLGALLRSRAARKNTKILLFVDQLEELYTLVSDSAERQAYTSCLLGAADDATAPLRVVVSMRSDFIDRVGEDRRFLDELTRGLVFLQPLGAPALRDALLQPLDMLGYRFETAAMIEQMLASLASTPGALPLLQFAAGRLWDARDRGERLLTHASYEAMGGIAGALATHADQVLGGLQPGHQQLARAVLLRLVTPERTRAIVDLRELRELSPDAGEVEHLVDQLTAARLLVVQRAGEAKGGGSVEVVHESLIVAWPTLRRWLDEGQDDAAQLEQLRTAAAQWAQRARAPGLLWRGDALAEARHWHARYRGQLPAREQAFLAAAFAAGSRSARIKRTWLIGVITLLSLLVVGASVGFLWIRDAEQNARTAEQAARTAAARADGEKLHAEQEAAKARAAERTAQDRYDQLKAEEAATRQAEDDALAKGAEVQMTREQLKDALVKAERARQVAEQESKKAHDAAQAAETAATSEKAAKAQVEALYLKAKAHADELEQQSKKITTELRK